MFKLLKFEILAWLDALFRWMPGRIGSTVRRYRHRQSFKSCGNVSFGTGCEFLSPQTMCFEGLIRVGNNSFFSAEGGAISVGAGTAFNIGVHINSSVGGAIRIGDSCLIGPNVVMRTAGHRFDDPRVPICKQGHIIGEINIEDNVWIGANAVILRGVRIGSGAVVGAGSVVVRDIAPMSIAVGVPAKVIKFRKDVTLNE